MKLSTKSTYGLRAMVDIALESKRGAISTMEISKEENISIAYLEQLLNRLRHKGLVKSVRGPKGGYLLAKRPGEITVRDIVKTLEGDISPVYCVTAEKELKKICDRSKICVTKSVWRRLAKAISDSLGSMTLEDLCAEARRKRKPS